MTTISVRKDKQSQTEDMLSTYCEQIRQKYNITIGQVKKLIPTLSNKEKCVIPFKNLQLYTDLGLQVNRVHRDFEFNQSLWLKQYNYFNTQKWTKAKHSFEKDFFKPMKNTVFGKTMENIR